MIKPWPLLPAVEGGFTADDFTPDTAAGTVTCPAGITRRITAKNAVILGAACGTARCATGAPPPRAGRTLHLHEPRARRPAARRPRRLGCRTGAAWEQKRIPAPRRTRHRPGRHPARRWLKLRYRATARNHAWFKHRTAAVNLRNLLGRGLALSEGTWILAT